MKIVKKWEVKLVRESSKKYEIDGMRVTSPMDAAKIVNSVFELTEEPREKFVMLAFDTKLNVIGAFEVFTGSVNSSLVHPREIFQRLLLVNATSFVVAHNHPSGDPTPSREDIEVTRRLNEAAQMMGIQFIDHMIIGDDASRYVSLKEKGYIR